MYQYRSSSHIINPQPCKMLLPPDQHYTVSPNYFTSQEQGEMQGVNFIPAACSLMERKECYASASFFHNRTEWRNRMIRTGRYLKHKTSQAFNSQRCKNCVWKYVSLHKWPGWVRYIVLKWKKGFERWSEGGRGGLCASSAQTLPFLLPTCLLACN